MKHLFLFLCTSFYCFASAQDDIYGYKKETAKIVKHYLDSVDNNSSVDGPTKCLPMYQPVLDKGFLDIRYSLGYFDDSRGYDIYWKGHNYGLSPSLDITIFETLRKQFISSCRGRLKLCNFKEVSAVSGKSVFEKTVSIHGRSLPVRLTLTYASASVYFEQNKGPLAALQRQLTLQSEDNFFAAFHAADVVFYNGHSRNGGGPDFAPPILNSKKKVDYDGYYEPQQIGFKKLLASLQESSNKGVILGLFSCYSQSHFYKRLIAQNPSQRMVLSSDTIDYFDTLKASVGYLEGLLRGSCGQELADTAKQNKKLRGGFQGFNLK